MELQTRDNSTRVDVNETVKVPVLKVDKSIFPFFVCMFFGFCIFVIFLLYKYSVNGRLLSE